MKTWTEYLHLPYRMELVEDTQEGGYVVSFPELPGCISCGATLEDAVANGQDAKAAWLQAAFEDSQPIPLPDAMEHYSGQFKLRIPKSLHRLLSSIPAGRHQHEPIRVYLLSQMMRCILSPNNAKIRTAI